MYDLHIHTTHSSDGQYGPDRIFEMARQRKLTGVAFTDHMDTTAAAQGMRMAPSYGLSFFTGVELSTVFSGKEHHLLLYGFRPDDRLLAEYISLNCRAIWEKAQDVLDVFVQMGFDIREEDVQGWGLSVPTGVTFLDALIKRNRADARLEEYLTGSKASSPYLNFYKDYAVSDIGEIVRSALPDLVETMRMLKGSGIFVLAHPGDADTVFLRMLKNEGLCGIEAYSTHHSRETGARLEDIAGSLDLLISAGSDYHGDLIKPEILLGDCSGQPDTRLIAMLERMGR